MTLYELYANKLVNEDDSDYQLCKSIFEFNGDFFAISELNETRRWIECHGDDYEFIKEIKNRHACIVLADIATCEEAIACEDAGADCLF